MFKKQCSLCFIIMRLSVPLNDSICILFMESDLNIVHDESFNLEILSTKLEFNGFGFFVNLIYFILFHFPLDPFNQFLYY